MVYDDNRVIQAILKQYATKDHVFCEVLMRYNDGLCIGVRSDDKFLIYFRGNIGCESSVPVILYKIMSKFWI